MLREPLRATERNRCLGQLVGCWPLPAELPEMGSKVKGESQAKGVRQLLGQGERLAAPLQGLLRIAKQPQG